MKPHPSEHWVCFACRKQFRKANRWNGIERELSDKPRHVEGYVCLECKGPMVDMGRYFRPPRRADKRGWEQMRLLAAHGIRYTSEAAIAYQQMVAGQSQTGPRQTRLLIAACPCHRRTEGQRLLCKIARHRERQALRR